MAYKVQIVISKKGMDDFLDLPGRIFRNDPCRVAPFRSEVKRVLDQKRNPYFHTSRLTLFVCYDRDIPVARLAVVINPAYREKTCKNIALFGFYESLDDFTASRLLFNAAEQFCGEQGIEFLEGPFNPNHYSEVGLLTGTYSVSPAFFESYNPPYYPEFLEKLGYRTLHRLHTRINRNTSKYLDVRYRSLFERDHEPAYRSRSFNLWHYRSELEKIREVFNDAFDGNSYFLPLNSEEYHYTAKYLFLITKPHLIRIIEYKDEPVAVLHCVLNVNDLLKPMHGRITPPGVVRFLMGRKKIKHLVIYAVGIKKKFQHTRVFGMVLHEMCKLCRDYPVVSTTWMSDDNVASVKASESIGLEPYKWFDIIGKPINPSDHE